SAPRKGRHQYVSVIKRDRTLASQAFLRSKPHCGPRSDPRCAAQNVARRTSSRCLPNEREDLSIWAGRPQEVVWRPQKQKRRAALCRGPALSRRHHREGQEERELRGGGPRHTGRGSMPGPRSRGKLNGWLRVARRDILARDHMTDVVPVALELRERLQAILGDAYVIER